MNAAKWLAFVTGAFGLFLVCTAVLSIWIPNMCGETVWWNMSTGSMEVRVTLAGIRVRTYVEPSGTEALFQNEQTQKTQQPQLLVYQRSLLQPRRGVGYNSKMLTLAKGICNSLRFNTISAQKRVELRGYVEKRRIEDLETFYSNFIENRSPSEHLKPTNAVAGNGSYE